MSDPMVRDPLTFRQLQLVCLVANGMRQSDIADNQHISYGTVGETLRYAREAAGAKTLEQLVAMCVADGFIVASSGNFVAGV